MVPSSWPPAGAIAVAVAITDPPHGLLDTEVLPPRCESHSDRNRSCIAADRVGPQTY
jgi:hypothetical protein